MKADIKLVIFDLDGTLVDAHRAVVSSLNYTLVQIGYAPVDSDTVGRAVGRGDRHLVGAFVDEDNISRALSLYRRHHTRALPSGTTCLPGARELLEGLKAKGYKLAVASNRATRFARIILRHLRIDHVFDCVLCADQVAHPKPAADILRHILAKFSLHPDEALYVGDMTVDIEAGHKAGVKTVAVGLSPGIEIKEERARVKPFRAINDILNVAKVVEELDIRNASHPQKHIYC